MGRDVPTTDLGVALALVGSLRLVGSLTLTTLPVAAVLLAEGRDKAEH